MEKGLVKQESDLKLSEKRLELEIKKFELEQRRSAALSKSAFFPDSMKGDVASAVIIYDLAERMNISVMEIAQSIYIIYNKPSFSTSFLVARLNDSKLLKGSLKTIISEDEQSCFCSGIDAVSGEKNTGMSITMKIAEAEGWVAKKGSKWKTMPGLMLRKRAQSFFIKEFYPQIMFGAQSREEIIDSNTAYVDIESEDITDQKAISETVKEKTLTELEFDKLILDLRNFEVTKSKAQINFKGFKFSEQQKEEINKAGTYNDNQLSEIIEVINSGKHNAKDFQFSITTEQMEQVENALLDIEAANVAEEINE